MSPPIIRITNGALRLSSGVLATGTGPLVLPFQDNLRHWYDFTDAGSLWQDTGLTSQVTANGQDIKGATDKGSNQLDVTEEDTPRTFDSTTYAWSTCLGSGNLAAPLSSYSFAPPQTFFCVYLNTTTNNGVPYHIGNSAGWEFESDGNSSPSPRYNSVGGQFTTFDSTDTWYGLIYVAENDNTQHMVHSNAGDKTASVITSKTITTGETVIGAFSNTGNFSHEGHIAECGAWNIGETEQPTIIADFQAYTEEKYSIVWA